MLFKVQIKNQGREERMELFEGAAGCQRSVLWVLFLNYMCTNDLAQSKIKSYDQERRNS